MKKHLFIFALLVLAACQSAAPPAGVKIGKPYSINGKTYHPEYDPSYDETGMASWYGPGFHGGKTANGEKFDTHDLTAAHPTLPMPSLVRVSNLENGKSAVVRINDRGPFARGRIIDLSSASAKRLGIKGLAKVRVQYLAKESEQYIAAMAEGRRIDMLAYNEQLESAKDANILAATAPSDQSFIIESTSHETKPGDGVASVAPVISVTNRDLPVQGQGKRGGVVLISEAVADEVNNRQQVAKPQLTPADSMMIQVGSFAQRVNAEKLKSSLAAIAPIVLSSVQLGGQEWWRVQAGPFAAHPVALQALERIRAAGYPDARMLKP